MCSHNQFNPSEHLYPSNAHVDCSGALLRSPATCHLTHPGRGKELEIIYSALCITLRSDYFINSKTVEQLPQCLLVIANRKYERLKTDYYFIVLI